MPKKPYKPSIYAEPLPTDRTFYPQNYRRPKPNMAHYNLQKAFKAIGGWRALADWGRQNPTEFYKIWAKLLPREILLDADVNGDIGDGNVNLIIEAIPSRHDLARYRELIGDIPGDYIEIEDHDNSK